MSKRVLVKADGGGGLQAFYNVGQGGGPSFRQLARRAFKDPTAGKVERIGAGLGLAGKIGAGLATGLQTAYGLQGGNVSSALQIPQTYMSLDPTVGQNAVVTPQEMQQQMRDQATKKLLEAQVGYATATGQNIGDVWQAGGQAMTNTTPSTNRGALRPDPTQAPPPQTAAQQNSSMYGQTMPNGQMTFNVQGQQPTASAATQPAANITNVNTDVAQAVEGMNVPSASESIQISNPFAGATPEVSSAVNNLVTGGMTGQGPVNPNNRQAMVNAGRNIGYEMASNISAQPTQTNNGYIQPAANTSYTRISGIPGVTSQRTQSASYQPSQKEQELIQRTAAQSGYFQQGELNALNNHRQSQGLPPLSLQEALELAKSFVEYAYELHGDILRKATPHEAGLLVMNMYLEMLR